jgi:hypothetical protein
VADAVLLSRSHRLDLVVLEGDYHA